MMPDADYIKLLFIKHAKGTCTGAETAMLVNYLEQGGHEEMLPMLDEIAVAVPGNFEMGPIAAERVLQHILAPAVTPVIAPARNSRLRWIGALAAAATLITAVVLLYRPAAKLPVLVSHSTTSGQVKHLLLPDGSQVTLNGNTTLTYDSAGWQPENREVWIKGEAFFNVAHDAAGHFKVHAGKEMNVEVLGTRFNVIAHPQDIRVILNSGKVKINITKPQQLPEQMVLLPGEMVSYQPDNNQLTRQQTDTLLLTSWKDGLISFRETTLSDIATMMTQQFGVKVFFTDAQLSKLQFTGTTPVGNLEVMLTILEKSLDLKIKRQNDQVVITKAK
jgi:transmembrane sensor